MKPTRFPSSVTLHKRCVASSRVTLRPSSSSQPHDETATPSPLAETIQSHRRPDSTESRLSAIPSQILQHRENGFRQAGFAYRCPGQQSWGEQGKGSAFNLSGVKRIEKSEDDVARIRRPVALCWRLGGHR